MIHHICGHSNHQTRKTIFTQCTPLSNIAVFMNTSAKNGNDQVKVGFIQKVKAKTFNFSILHSCAPKIVPEILFPVHLLIINKQWQYFEFIQLKNLLIMNYS